MFGFTAFIHAVFNANAYGVWVVLFVSKDKLIIGAAGLIGAILCLILGLSTLYVINRERKITSFSPLQTSNQK